MSTIRCPHCGATNRGGSNYCNNCGVDLRGEQPVEQAAPDAAAVEPEASAASQPAPDAPPELIDEQPWLRPEANGEEEESEPSPLASRRLVTNIQGLLDPVRIFSEATDETELAALPPVEPPPLAIGADQVRRLRLLMAEEPVIVDRMARSVRQLPTLRTRWITLLLIIALAAPLLLRGVEPAGPLHLWPGVDAAYAAVNALSPGAQVLLLWAYDPPMADELDLLALPLVAHLLEREIQPVVISLLPTGLPTARRLFAQVIAPEVQDSSLRLAVGGQRFVNGGFLPGGPAALALIGQDLPTGLTSPTAANAVAAAAQPEPALAILLAAQAEEAQQWLEQTAPLNPIPVVAFTSAAADPVLRPYWDSGQLAGLVSGFDGAAAYQQLRKQTVTSPLMARLARQLRAQNWGQAAFILLIVLGNLAALASRRSEA